MGDENKRVNESQNNPSQYADTSSLNIEEMLYARSAEVESLNDLQIQRATQIPALFSQFYKFIQNPSSVSVETYKRMIDTDDTIGSGVDFLTTCLAARLGRYQHKSKEVTSWVNDRLTEIEGGGFNVIKELLSATWAGFAVAEKVWANTENGFVPKKILSLPPSTILFESNRTGELTDDGILQYQRNYNPNALSGGIQFFGGNVGNLGFATDLVRPDLFAKFGDLPFPMRTANSFAYMSIRIPKMKAIHYSFDAQGKFGNHYGRSLLRRCYKFHVMKDAFLQMLSIALDRKGTPLTIVYADHNTTLVDPTKVDPTGNNRGKRGVGIRADVAAQQAFKNVHNDTFIVLPGKKDQIYGTDFVPQASNTADFIEALNFCNRSIIRALLIPALIFNTGDGSGSYALGQEHSRTFDKILDGMLEGLKHVLIQQLIMEMVAYNFPRSAWEKDGLGDFSKREFSQEEKQKEAEMFEKACNIGVIDSNDLNDLNQMRDTLGFEPRDTPIEKPLDGIEGLLAGGSVSGALPSKGPMKEGDEGAVRFNPEDNLKKKLSRLGKKIAGWFEQEEREPE